MKRLNRYLFLLNIYCGFSVSVVAQNFHSMTLETFNGFSSLNELKNKTVLVITSAVDISIDLNGLEDLQKRYPELVVIEMPLKRFSRGKPIIKAAINNVILTKEAGDSTDFNGRLLRWLTAKEGNQHFEVNKVEIGQKYFIDGKGELYAILPPDFKLTDARIDAIIKRTSFQISE